MAKPIDKKLLEGLTYHWSEAKEAEKDGRKRVVYTPQTRPLEPGDVLDWRDTGDQVVLVTADGQKVTVAKSTKGRAAE